MRRARVAAVTAAVTAAVLAGGALLAGAPGADGETAPPATTTPSATTAPSAPNISASPSVVGNQQLPAPFQVTPSQNFPVNDSSALTVDGNPQTFTTAPDGSLDFTASPPCGPHRVTLTTQTDRAVAISADAPIAVLCPQITLTPASISKAHEPATVLVTGSQFHASQPVTISLDGTAVGSTVTDSGGGFTKPITARGLGCAAHQVQASEQAQPGGPAFLLSAGAPLPVTGCAMTLAINPAVLEPGELTQVTGTGFTPGTPVILSWRASGGGAPLLGTLSVTVGASGTFGGFFMVMPDDLLGPRQLVATQGATKLTANALVDAAPTQPSAGDRLIYRG